jgi:hypothetical protein
MLHCNQGDDSVTDRSSDKQVPYKNKHIKTKMQTNRRTNGYFLIDWQQGRYTEKKENIIFLIVKEIQKGAVAKSYMRKDFLIYEEMPKYLLIYEEAVSHV